MSTCVGRDISGRIATRHQLDGPGIESMWGRDFPHPTRLTLVSTQPPIGRVPCLYREKSGWGVALTTHPIQPRSERKNRAISFFPLWTFVACSRVSFTFTFYVYWFLNPLNAELNSICYLLALLGAHHFLHVSRIRVNNQINLAII